MQLQWTPDTQHLRQSLYKHKTIHSHGHVACVSKRNNNANACEPLFPTILSTCLPSQVGANIGEEQLVSIAERTIMEADVDKDNLISFEEFKKVLERTDVEQKMSIRFLS